MGMKPLYDRSEKLQDLYERLKYKDILDPIDTASLMMEAVRSLHTECLLIIDEDMALLRKELEK